MGDVKLMQVKPSVCCWVCHKSESSEGFSAPIDWIPDGWRRVRRGYAGEVTICKSCYDAGFRYQRDAVWIGRK